MTSLIPWKQGLDAPATQQDSTRNILCHNQQWHTSTERLLGQESPQINNFHSSTWNCHMFQLWQPHRLHHLWVLSTKQCQCAWLPVHSRLHYLEVCNAYSVHWGNLDDNFRRAVRANACVIGVTRTSFRIVSTTSTASDSVIWIDPLNPSNTCKCSIAREESFLCPRHSEMTPRWQLIKMLKTGQNAFSLQVKTLDLWTLKKFKH